MDALHGSVPPVSVSVSVDAPASDWPLRMLDPVCEMLVDPRDEKAVPRVPLGGQLYFFCRPGCAEEFQKKPALYLDPEAKARMRAAQDPEAEYTCPMDPEVVQKGPGICPKCGMALEPAHPTVGDGKPSEEERSMRARFVVGFLFTLPLVVLSMQSMLPVGQGTHGALGVGSFLPLPLVLAGLALPVVTWVGWPFHQRAVASLLNRSPNMFTLIGIGVWVSILASLYALWDPRQPQYWEAAASTLTLVALGQWLEIRARAQTGDAVRELLARVPARVTRLVPDPDSFGVYREEEVEWSALQVGERVRVLPGAAIPIDGRIVEGATEVDESMMTGEPLSVAKSRGDFVIGGTINGTGAIVVAATRVGQDTELSRIVEGVLQAQRTRAPVQAWVDRVSAFFVPAVVLVAGVTFGLWIFVSRSASGFSVALSSAVAVLVVACPCALGLATPVAVLVAAGRGARAGILFRDAAALERLSQVDVLLMDKTGTLTEGKPRVVAAVSLGEVPERTWVALAAALERSSEQPLAQAVLRYAHELKVDRIPARDVKAVPGGGIYGIVQGQEVFLGSERFLQHEGLVGPFPEAAEVGIAVRKEGGLLSLCGLLQLEDRVRASARAQVGFFLRVGVRLAIASGDRASNVARVARELGIAEFRGGLQPAEKQAWIQEWQTQGLCVGMIGDGLNDAAALAQADVGVAIGTGTEAARAAAGVTLLRGDLGALVRAFVLSRKLRQNIGQNLWLAFGYNALAIPVAGGLLTPLLGWQPSHLAPMLGAAAMSLSSVSVIMNALRLSRARL